MNNTIQHIEAGLKNSYSYAEYEQLVEDLLREGKSTTKGAQEEMVHFSKLGLQRMKRWDKKFALTSAQKEKICCFDQKRTWIVLIEGWCGDAAHSVPVIHKIAEANEHIDLRLVLREENPDLMNNFLTNGGKSIPKLIVYDPENKQVEDTWGPRPTGAKEIFDQYRNDDFMEVLEPKLQGWYNKDKGETTAAEIIDLLS